MTSNTQLCAVLSVAAAGLFANPIHAQVARTGGNTGAANAQLAQQYQQATAERDKLQSDNAKLKSDLDDTRKQLKAAQQQLATLRAGTNSKDAAVAAAQAAKESTAKSLEDLKAKADDLVGHFRDTVAVLKGVETDRARLQQQLYRSRTAFDRCVLLNDELYKVNGEVLDRYEHEGTFGRLARAEPFTGLERTKVENLVDETHQHADELRVERQEEAAAAAAAASKPAAPQTPDAPKKGTATP
jgi:chromosome segregation ATPase